MLTFKRYELFEKTINNVQAAVLVPIFEGLNGTEIIGGIKQTKLYPDLLKEKEAIEKSLVLINKKITEANKVLSII